MATIIENFEKTEDGLPPPQVLLTEGQPTPQLRFPTMAIHCRNDVAYFAPPSAGTFLPGNFIGVPESYYDHPFYGGGVVFIFKEPVTKVALDFWIAGSGTPGTEGMRVEYSEEGSTDEGSTRYISDAVLQTKSESYHGTVESPPLARKIKHIRVTSPGHPGAVGHFVLTTDGSGPATSRGDGRNAKATVRETFESSTNLATPTLGNPTTFGEDWVDAGFRYLRVSAFGTRHDYGLVDTEALSGYVIGVSGFTSFVLTTPVSSVAFDYYMSEHLIPVDDIMHVCYLDADGALIGERSIPSVVGGVTTGTLRSDPNWSRRIKAVEMRSVTAGNPFVGNFELVD